MVSLLKLSLKDIDVICSSLGGIVNSLMNRNALALIIGSTGEVTFSKQASKVLLQSWHNHPIQRLIMNACNQYCSKTGDDCKMFLLFLKELMHGVKTMLKNHDEIYVRTTLSHEIASLLSFLPGLFEDLRITFAVISNSNTYLDSFSKDLEGIVATFFDSRFPIHISKKLCELFCEFLCSSLHDWSQIVNFLQYVLLKFDLFCSKALLPYSDSVILSGFILYHRLLYKPESTNYLGFIVVWDVSQKFDNATWNVEMKSLPLQMNYFWLAVEKTLTILKEQEISVILTPSSGCHNLKSLCCKKQIILIDKLANDDIHNILFLNDISPLDNLNDTLNSRNIANLMGIHSITFGNFHYTHLKVFDCRNCKYFSQTTGAKKTFIPNHVMLCAPTEDIWREYYLEFHCCLKMTLQWLNPTLNNFFCSTKVEQFIYQNNNIGSVASVRHIEKSLKICREFLKESKILSRTISDLYQDNSGAFAFFALGLSVPLGLWEYVFRIGLENISFKKQVLFSNLHPILEAALLNIICKNWNVSLCCFKGKESFFEFYSKMKHRLTFPIEPVLSKEDMIFDVLLLLQQLLKIDAVIGSK